MTDPYTDADLRIEAAKQHATLTDDPDFMGVGEQMEYSTVETTKDGETSLTWAQLLVPEGGTYEAYGAAQRKVHDLVRKAADLSDWAVNLGADELEPSPHVLNLDGDDKPIVRLHMAFHPDMDERARIRFGMGLAQAMANAL